MKMSETWDDTTSGPSMSSVADSHVRTSAASAAASALTANGLDFGLNLRDSFASYDPDTRSWKTRRVYLNGDSEEYLETWPMRGMTQSGRAYELSISARHITGRGSLLLPTPTRSMGRRGWGVATKKKGRYSQIVIRNALLFGWRPPVSLLEWMMGYPPHHTVLAWKPLATLSSRKSRNGSRSAS